MARIVVAGYMIRYPLAGNLLAFFHYILGLARLGHQVAYFEESGWPYSSYDPVAGEWRDDPQAGLPVVQQLIADHQLAVPVCFVNRETGSCHGMEWGRAKELLRAADLLINVGGVSWLPEFRRVRRRALIDMDPLFTQLGRFGADLLDEHQTHWSYGANIRSPSCSIPRGTTDWRPTVPPVVPEIWAHRDRQKDECSGGIEPGEVFTTIANWNAYGSINHHGKHYGQKDEEFLRLIDLPSRTTQKLELALSGAEPQIVAQFRAAGWSVRPAEQVSVDLPSYQGYIKHSRAEFSVAKHAYVVTRSGWFSDRSVSYLAAGRPVVIQDCGFSEWLPTGRGVVAFSSLDQAVSSIEAVNADYRSHCRAASEMAERVFHYREVLGRLLETALR